MKRFKIAAFTIFSIVIVSLALTATKYLNPRNSQDIEIEVNSNLVKVQRLTIKNELQEVYCDEKINDTTYKYILERVFVQNLIVSLPINNVIDPIHIKINIDDQIYNFSSKQIKKNWLKLDYKSSDSLLDTNFNSYQSPLSSQNTSIPFFKNIINVPAFSLKQIIKPFILLSLIAILLFLYLLFFKDKKIIGSNRAWVVILITTIFISILIGFLTYQINKSYLHSNPYYLDPVANNLRLIKNYELQKTRSKFDVVIHEINTNEINPFRSIPLILLKPSLLAENWGHTINTFIALLLFLFLLGNIIYKKTNNLLFAISSLLFFVSAPIIYDGRDGIFPFWQDFSAGLLFGSASICFISWYESKKTFWVLFFSILISFSIASRYNVVFYAVLTFVPAFLLTAYQSIRNKEDINKTVIFPLITIILTTGLLIGYWLFKHLDYNLNYYGNSDVYGATGLGIKPCLIGLLGRILIYFKETYLLFLCLTIIFSFYLIQKNKTFSKTSIFIFSWLILIIPVYWVFVLGLDAMKLGIVELVAYPIIFSTIFSFFDFRSLKYQINLNYLSLIILPASIFLISDSFIESYSKTKNQNSVLLLEEKKIQVFFAEKIAEVINSKSKPQLSFNNFITREQLNYNLALETFYKTNYLLNYTNVVFSTDSLNWHSKYKNMSNDSLAEFIYKKATSELDVILTLNDTSYLEKADCFKNKLNKAIAKKISTSLPQNKNWSKIGELKTNKYSLINLYYKIN